MIPNGDSLEIAVERRQGTTTLSLNGALTFQTLPVFRDEATMALADEWIAKLQLNLSALSGINHSGLWILTLAQRTAADRLVDFAICNPSPAAMRFLGGTRLREFMQLETNE